MEFVKPTVTPISTTGESTPQEMIKVIERAYRICYKSEGMMGEGSEELIHRLLYGGEKGKMIHTSPLEHRRINIAIDDWVADVILDYQDEKHTSFICINPIPKTPSADDHQWMLEGNLRAFFDFVKGYTTREGGDVLHDFMRRNEARLVINNELHKFFPVVFKYFEPWEDTDNAIDWEGVTYVGESTDYMSFHVITSRDVLQEIARNRTISPNVESTRYCNYNKRGIKFCLPVAYEWSEEINESDAILGTTSGIDVATKMSELYTLATRFAEDIYNKAIKLGVKPQEARMLLPGCLKTEMILTGRYVDWAHFLKLRNDPAADPQMQTTAKQIEEWFVANGHADIREYDHY